MNIPAWLIAILTAALGALGTVVVGLLVHLREKRRIGPENEKNVADADKARADAVDIHWRRFEREIDRLSKRVETLETEVRECHREKRAVEIELAQMRLDMLARGNNRQTAQLVISELRAEGVELPKKGG